VLILGTELFLSLPATATYTVTTDFFAVSTKQKRDYPPFFDEKRNHLGNVLVTFVDRKTGHLPSGATSYDYWNPDLATVTDYYPFGSVSRSLQAGDSSSYRYGFQGQRKDNSIAGDGNHYQFKFREYNPLLGRFWSVDPLAKSYPWNGSYNFAEDRVTDGVDLEGKEFYSMHINEMPDGSRTLVGVVNYTNIKQAGMTNVSTPDGYGPQGNVGVNYTITKVDMKGNALGKTGFNVKNLYGVYQGPDNPKKYWEKPNEHGEYPDDYSLSPIDEADANGKQHDLDYDAAGIKGAGGVFGGVTGDKGSQANQGYINRADKVIAKEKTGGKDDITGKPVTNRAAAAAKEGKALFQIANSVKEDADYNQGTNNK